MVTPTLAIVGVALFAIGGLCSVLVVALATMSRENSEYHRVVEVSGVHPLEKPKRLKRAA